VTSSILPVAALWAALSAMACSKSPAPAMPHPDTGADADRAASAVETNAACAGCHAEVAAEWRASYHARAATDPAFQAALAVEPLPFCRGCHAGEAPPGADTPADLAALGVACTTCHSPDREVLAAPRSAPSLAPHGAPHRTLRAAAFATAAACAGCHEFDFPDSARRLRPEPMQLTASEHAGSPYAEVACAGCHMPFAGEGAARHRSHAFASRAPGAQAHALRVRATRTGGAVALTLEPAEIGHAFPTGDLFRRLSILAEVAGDDGALIASQSRYLGRHFRQEVAPDGHRARTTALDDRPGAPAMDGAPVTVAFDFGRAACGRPVDVRIAYQRVAHVMDGLESRAAVDSEVAVFEQSLPDPTRCSP